MILEVRSDWADGQLVARPVANPRPLLVQLTNRAAKNLITENLYKVKHLESQFNNVILAHDMTTQERTECKMLVEEAKNQTAEDSTGKPHIQGQGRIGDDESRTVSPQLNSDCEDETNLRNSRLTEHSDNRNNTYQAVNSNNSNSKVNELKCLYTNTRSLVLGSKREELQILIDKEVIDQGSCVRSPTKSKPFQCLFIQ